MQPEALQSHLLDCLTEIFLIIDTSPIFGAFEEWDSPAYVGNSIHFLFQATNLYFTVDSFGQTLTAFREMPLLLCLLSCSSNNFLNERRKCGTLDGYGNDGDGATKIQ